ncbi:MAG: glutathione synthase, partial [Deltaproteobacteria bacterium]|nr:glutathione synthase [Deltaproteobacteria bacterium]
MRIGFVVNDVKTEETGYTTTRLAMAAINRGHEAWVIGAGDFAYDEDESIRARATSAPKSQYKSSDAYIADLKGRRAKLERISVDELDVLLLRSDPSADLAHRSWAQGTGIIFGRVAMRRGLIVLNDPNGLSKAMNKMYFQLYPEEVRPRTVITRDRDEIRDFWKEQGGNIVLKPLQGSGGQGVFLVRGGDGSNL